MGLSGCHLAFPHGPATAPPDAAAADRAVPIEATVGLEPTARDLATPLDQARLVDVILREKALPAEKGILPDQSAAPDKGVPKPDKSMIPDKGAQPDKSVLLDKGPPKPDKLIPKLDREGSFDGPCAPCVLPMTDCGCACECFPPGTWCLELQCKY